jgi:hypothetical protein
MIRDGQVRTSGSTVGSTFVAHDVCRGAVDETGQMYYDIHMI